MTAKNSIDAGTSAHDVLKLLFEHGPQRQSQIAERLQVSVAACNRQFKKLSEEGFIVGCADPVSSGGRPSQSWRIENDGNTFLGVLFYDGVLSAVLIDFAARTLWRRKCAVDPACSRKEFSGKLLAAAEAACRQAEQAGWRILCCFIGIPGLIACDGTVLNMPNFPALNGLNPERLLSDRFGLKCFCDAMYYAYVLSETSALAPEATALVLDWCDGFGGIVVSNRRILNWPAIYPRRRRGIWNLGHVRVEAGGALCHCGSRGCLEAYVGGLSLRENHPELGCGSDQELAGMALRGDPAAVQVLRQAARRIGEALYWTVELFGVDTVIFTGTYSEAFDLYRSAFLEGLSVLHTPEEMLEFSVLANRDPERNFSWGAALMARHYFFYPEEPTQMRGLGRLHVPTPRPEGASRRSGRHSMKPSLA